MDSTIEKKIRDLQLRILKLEKELAATQHNVQLSTWLRAGHASQMTRAGERERKRIETQLSELREKLSALRAQSASPSAPAAGTESAATKPAAAAKRTRKSAK